MLTPTHLTKAARSAFLAVSILMLGMALIQCYTTASGIHWFYDPDYYRDMSCVQQNLSGNFGKDPNYTGAYLWYNPLLTWIETMIVKISGLPLNEAFARAGVWLNLLAPITFTAMLVTLFDWRIAVAGLLSYLFLASGNHFTFDAATYSPWLYPGSFTQAIFYLNIIFCYKAFTTQKMSWFLLLGAMLGISFLGHTAPTILLILIMVILQTGNLIKSVREKDYTAVRRYVGQGAAVLALFILFSMPLLYFIVGKYRLKFINRMPFEFVEDLFIYRNLPGTLLHMDLSVALLIALIGVVWFFRNGHQPVSRKMILSWPILCLFLFVYSTAVSSLDRNRNIHLPGTVPAFHYFFYLKAVQSVFFGFGLVFLLQYVFSRIKAIRTPQMQDILLAATMLLCAIIYYPFYRNRQDFVYYRTQNLQMDKDTDRIQTYHYILNKVPSDKVILCEESTSIFPVMATARKMVSNGITYSNPYVDFWQRENARNSMLSYIKTGQPSTAKQLFTDYQVDFILLSNTIPQNADILSKFESRLVYKNGTYSLYCIKLSPAGNAGGQP